MATLTQYWSDEIARRQAALDAARADLESAREDLANARAALIAAGEAEHAHAEEIVALRRRLASIPLPADGDALLVAMETARVGRARARDARVRADVAHKLAGTREAHMRALERAQTEAHGEAHAALLAAQARAERVQALSEALTTGAAMQSAADASQALADHEAAARGLIEAAFPASGTAARDFLRRVRDRRDLAATEAALADERARDARARVEDAVTRARAAEAVAFEALRHAAEAGPAEVAEASATLARLAAQAAAPITPEQSAELKDASRRSARETALTRLRAVDLAARAHLGADVAYRKALDAARADHPDATQAELDAGVLQPLADALTTRASDLATARDAYGAADADLLAAWFAAVPEGLWQALEAFDAAVARLTHWSTLAPTDLIDALDTREDELTQALAARQLEARQQAERRAALAEADAERRARADTVAARATAMSHAAGAF